MIRTTHQFFSLRAIVSICLLPALVLGGLPIASCLARVLADSAQSAASEEYQIKAAYLLNFAKFIEWPASVFPAADTPITVGVLGDDPFGSTLEQTFQGESANGRKLVVKRSRRVEDLQNCQMIFVSNSEKDRVTDILASLKDASIVTVGETDQFAERGGIINFYLNAGKIRFEINADAAEQKGLKINSQLLKRARIVKSN